MPRTEVRGLRSASVSPQCGEDSGERRQHAMSRTLHDLSSLPSTLVMMSPTVKKRKETDSIALLENERSQDCLKVDVMDDHTEDPEEKLNKCDKVDENISSPTEKNVPRTKNDSTKDKNFFRRIAGVSDEVGKLPICFRSQKHYLGSLNTSQYQYKQFII